MRELNIFGGLFT
jgi:hypothetical protein